MRLCPFWRKSYQNSDFFNRKKIHVSPPYESTPAVWMFVQLFILHYLVMFYYINLITFQRKSFTRKLSSVYSLLLKDFLTQHLDPCSRCLSYCYISLLDKYWRMLKYSAYFKIVCCFSVNNKINRISFLQRRSKHKLQHFLSTTLTLINK